MGHKEQASALICALSLLVSVSVILAKCLHERPKLASVVPEAGMIILLGVLAGFLATVLAPPSDLADALTSFSPDMFFILLLPPIIFNSGYHLKRELFFRHMVPILLFAVVGTAVSAVCIALFLHGISCLDLLGQFRPTLAELLTFGALISATDPVSTLAVFQAKRVDPQLFYLVFGESVLNDAVGLVLFENMSELVSNPESSPLKLVQHFVINFLWDAIGSPIVGILGGVALSYLFKVVDMQHNVLMELSLYVFVCHVPYLVGELLGLSGIVVTLFTGIAARAYVVPNLSQVTELNADLVFRLLAFLAETVIFLDLGLSVFSLSGYLELRFTLWSLVACLVGRALNVYPLAAFSNWSIRRKQGVDMSLEEEIASSERRTTSAFNGANSGKKVNGSDTKSSSRVPQKKTSTSTEESSLLGSSSNSSIRQSNASASKDIKISAKFYQSVRTPQARGDLKILPNVAHMLWFSGLRGAVAYACVKTFPDTMGNQDTFTVTTMAIVLITVFALGSTTETMLNYWRIETDVDEDEYMDSWNAQASMPKVVLKFEEFIDKHVIREDHLNFILNDDDSNDMDTYLTHSVRHVHLPHQREEADHNHNLNSIHHTRNTAFAHTLSTRGGIFDFGQD